MQMLVLHIQSCSITARVLVAPCTHAAAQNTSNVAASFCTAHSETEYNVHIRANQQVAAARRCKQDMACGLVKLVVTNTSTYILTQPEGCTSGAIYAHVAISASCLLKPD